MTTKDEINRVAEHLVQTYKVGANIPGYRLLSVDLDVDEKVYREIIIALECFSLVDIKLNNTVLIADTMATKASSLEARFKDKLNYDGELQKLLRLLSKEYEVGEKLPSEEKLMEQLSWGKQKIREQLLRLQFSEYVECKSRVGRVLIKELPDFKDARPE
jgi:DNA-binding FadR family transcriptional regulator